MIGYVLLIIIAIGLSVAVFSFLKLYVPPSTPECPDDVKLTIDAYTCTDIGSGEFDVSITLTNRGLFKVYGVYIRMGEDRIYKPLINEEDFIFFANGGAYLHPEVSAVKGSYVYSEGGFDGGERIIEIEPIYLEEEEGSIPAVCENALVRKTITCPSAP